MTANLKPQIELRHLSDTEINAVRGGDKKGTDPLPKLPDDPIWTPIKILGGVLWWLEQNPASNAEQMKAAETFARALRQASSVLLLTAVNVELARPVHARSCFISGLPAASSPYLSRRHPPYAARWEIGVFADFVRTTACGQ